MHVEASHRLPPYGKLFTINVPCISSFPPRVTPNTPPCWTALFTVPKATHTLGPPYSYLYTGWTLCAKYSAPLFSQTNSFLKIMLKALLSGKSFKDLFRENICFLLSESKHAPSFNSLSPTTDFNLSWYKISSTRDSARHTANIMNAHRIHLAESSICKILLAALNTHG